VAFEMRSEQEARGSHMEMKENITSRDTSYFKNT
jgi:hypothetical protein